MRSSGINFSGLAKILYRKYPKIAENLVDHYRFYNETISYMNQIKQKTTFILFSLAYSFNKRNRRSKEKLVNLYNLGYTDAQYHYENLLNWIEIKGWKVEVRKSVIFNELQKMHSPLHKPFPYRATAKMQLNLKVSLPKMTV